MDNKTICITGATAGIGEATARLLAQNGHRLILIGRRADRLEKMKADLIKTNNIDCLTISLDVRDRTSVSKLIGELPSEWADIDILINNAGLAAGLDPVYLASFDDWDQMIDTNVKGLLYMTRLLTPGMVSRGRGHIVNIGSIAGKEVYPNASVYCATKHAVDAINKGMRIDLVPFGIRVTAINPGAVETEFSVVRFKGDREKADKVYKGFTPLTGHDIAEAVLFVIDRPEHVNINDLIIMPTAQASASQIHREEK
ncbi:MAG: SDR family oxidoreductase [Bacteroidales bacterium]|nr:SDR family oxidoreductase [Bacteroidales bacterium]